MSHCSWDKWDSTGPMGEGCLIQRICQMRPGINHKEESGENIKIKGWGEKINSCAMGKWLIRVIWGGKRSRIKYFSAQKEWREYLQQIPRHEPLLAKTQKHYFPQPLNQILQSKGWTCSAFECAEDAPNAIG